MSIAGLGRLQGSVIHSQHDAERLAQPGNCQLLSASRDSSSCPNALHRSLLPAATKPLCATGRPQTLCLLICVSMRMPCTCARRSRHPVLLPRSTPGSCCGRRQRGRAGTRRRLLRRGLSGRLRRGYTRALRPRPLQRRILRDGRLHAVHGQPVRHHAHLDRHLRQRRIDYLCTRELIQMRLMCCMFLFTIQSAGRPAASPPTPVWQARPPLWRLWELRDIPALPGQFTDRRVSAVLHSLQSKTSGQKDIPLAFKQQTRRAGLDTVSTKRASTLQHAWLSTRARWHCEQAGVRTLAWSKLSSGSWT